MSNYLTNQKLRTQKPRQGNFRAGRELQALPPIVVPGRAAADRLVNLVDRHQQLVVERLQGRVDVVEQLAGVRPHHLHLGDPVGQADVHQVDQGLIVVLLTALLQGLLDQVVAAHAVEITQHLSCGEKRRGRRELDQRAAAGTHAERIVEQPHGPQAGREPEGGLPGLLHFAAEEIVQFLLLGLNGHVGTPGGE